MINIVVKIKIIRILSDYQKSFSSKTYPDENNDSDILMDVFHITPEIKREHKQYWGRELGMVWERIVKEVFREHSDFYGEALKDGKKERCDCVVHNYAIDTKYRIGSGDSGTLRKLKRNGELLKELGYQPVLLILREDNLPSALSSCLSGGWTILTGKESLSFIEYHSGVQVKNVLNDLGDAFHIERDLEQEA